MNLADAFSTLDHDALNTIYDSLPFVRTLSQDSGSLEIPLKERQKALAEALLLARDSFLHTQRDLDFSGNIKKARLARHSQYEDSEEEDSSIEESEEEDDKDEEGLEPPQENTLHQDSTLVSSGSLAQIPIRTSSSNKFQQYGPHLVTINPPLSREDSPASIHPQTYPSATENEQQSQVQVVGKSNIFIVPPTVNPYDPLKDYLPQWLKRTYMYWRWTLKQTVHDVPQRYAVWISLHLNDPSIRYHIQNVSSVADEGRFESSVEVNDYILKKAAGHIKVQEDIARNEFNHLVQVPNTSIITFNSDFLRVFNKVRHFYHPDRLAIQYYDRIIPRIRKRLNVNFYERYTSSNSSTRSRSYPTIESLMLAAEQVDDFYRPLPPVPKRLGFFQVISSKSKTTIRKSHEKLKMS